MPLSHTKATTSPKQTMHQDPPACGLDVRPRGQERERKKLSIWYYVVQFSSVVPPPTMMNSLLSTRCRVNAMSMATPKSLFLAASGAAAPLAQPLPCRERLVVVGLGDFSAPPQGEVYLRGRLAEPELFI